LQSSNQIITTNTEILTGWITFLSPNQQCQSTEEIDKLQWVNGKHIVTQSLSEHWYWSSSWRPLTLMPIRMLWKKDC